MKDYLNNLPKEIRDLIYLAGEVAEETKVYAYLVGGIVRDLILGIPNLDLDIVIQGDGLMFAAELARRLQAKLTTHPRFGTATLMTPKKIKLDIATCRSEIYPEPASLPVVSPGAIKEDLARRDFTINALAIDLHLRNFGSLVDFYQGRRDLKAGSIRILHDLSFIDDPTRIIRAVRLEQRLKFRIEPHSLRLLKQAADAGMLRRVSPHRIRDEIALMLKESCALECILRMQKLVGFNFIHQKLKLRKVNLRYLAAIKSQIDWFKGGFPRYGTLDIWLMYFIGLLSSLNNFQINQVCKRFGLRREEIKKVVSYSTLSLKMISRLSKRKMSASQIYQNLEALSPEVILLIKAKHRNRFLSRNIQEFFRRCTGIRTYILGGDLTRLGLKPSSDYKKILTRLLYLQLDGQINSRQEALEWVKKWLLPS